MHALPGHGVDIFDKSNSLSFWHEETFSHTGRNLLSMPQQQRRKEVVVVQKTDQGGTMKSN